MNRRVFPMVLWCGLLLGLVYLLPYTGLTLPAVLLAAAVVVLFPLLHWAITGGPRPPIPGGGRPADQGSAHERRAQGPTD
ncbi:MAG: hypothetical protein AB1505_00675 [Candidatus Latescibacterota bacterium]